MNNKKIAIVGGTYTICQEDGHSLHRLIEPEPTVYVPLPKMEEHIYGTLTKKQSKQEVIPVLPSSNIGRNDACPCGSGKKYKKCCLA